MPLIACGVNHISAPLAIREKLAFKPYHLPQALTELKETGLEEALIVSTCNRTEIYSYTDQGQRLPEWIIRRYQVAPEHLYLHQDNAAIRHVLRVASGLDSMVLGEPQILGQLKKAYQMAQLAGTVGAYLNPLFQYTFATSKKIRTQTGIGAHPVSFAYAIITQAKKIFEDLRSTSALLLGSGEMVALTARYLHDHPVQTLVIANRTLEKSVNLAKDYHALAIDLTQIQHHLQHTDIIVCATQSPLPIIGKGLMERTLKKRRHRPMLLIDLSVPRNIEPEIGHLEDAYLYTVDDLHGIIKENLKYRQDAATQAEYLIDHYCEHYLKHQAAKQSRALICQYREQLKVMAQPMLKKSLSALSNGEDPALVLSRFSDQLLNKIMHGPTVQLFQASLLKRTDFLDVAKQLLGIPNGFETLD